MSMCGQCQARFPFFCCGDYSLTQTFYCFQYSGLWLLAVGFACSRVCDKLVLFHTLLRAASDPSGTIREIILGPPGQFCVSAGPPFGTVLWSFWALWDRFGYHFGPPGTILEPAGSLLEHPVAQRASLGNSEPTSDAQSGSGANPLSLIPVF